MAGLQTIETLKATGRENDFFVRWAGQFAKVMNSQQELSVITMATGALPKIIHLLINVSILILGSYKVMNGQLTMGMLVAFQSLMASFLAAVSGLMGLVTSLQEMEGDMTRLDDIMKTEGDKYVVKARKKKQKDYSQLGQKLEGYIDFKNVLFGYSKFSDPNELPLWAALEAGNQRLQKCSPDFFLPPVERSCWMVCPTINGKGKS